MAIFIAISPLSEWSVARQGETVKIPDFTCGAWKTNDRGMDNDPSPSERARGRKPKIVE